MMRPIRVRLALAVALLAASPVHAFDGEPAVIDSETLRITELEDRRESGPELRTYLGSPRAHVRARAALAAGRIGHPADVAALSEMLADPDVTVRRAVVFGLGEIEDSTAAMPLAELLTSGRETDARARAFAVEALGKLRWGAEACRHAIDDADADVRARALLAAWQIPVPAVTDRAVAALDDADAHVRWAAAYALMRLAGAPASGATPIASAAALSPAERRRVGDALAGLVGDPDPEVRTVAIRGLRRAGSPEVTALLVDRMRDSDWRVRVEVVRALGSDVDAGGGAGANADDGAAGDPAAVGSTTRSIDVDAIAPLLADPHPNVLVEAVGLLATVGDDSTAFARLAGFSRSPDDRVSIAAFDAMLARWSDADSLDAAARERVGAEIDAMRRRRAWAARAAVIGALPLVERWDAERAGQLARDLVSDRDPRVAKLAVGDHLRHLAGAASGPLWSRVGGEVSSLTRHDDPMVRLMALYGTSALFQADSVYAPTDDDWTRFATTLDDVYEVSRQVDSLTDVREAVVDVAANWLDRPAYRDVVQKGIDDSNYVVRRAALGALESGGIDSPRQAEPVVSRYGSGTMRQILEWANSDHWAVWDTESGRIVAKLFSRDAPLTCWNLLELANAGFYDQGAWHRVVPNFVLQDGCPRGDGWGGPDWQIRCEINPRRYAADRLGMALSGKDTGGSQYFFTHSAQPHLDGRYTVFGEIVEGAEAAARVTQGMRIRSVRVLDVAP